MLSRRLAWLAVLTLAVPAAAADRKPNVVVIVGDDMGYADIGVHGCKDIPTPNIDALAKAGTRCMSGYVSGPYCSPTRAGLLTGRYQQRFGHEFNPGPVPDKDVQFGLSLKETTLAARLKAAGYKTGMVGKWHLGHDPAFVPTVRGFDEFYGFLGGAHSYTEAGKGQNGIHRGLENVDEKEYLTDAFSREAVAFIDRHAKEPFFLYLTFNAVHTPMQAPAKYLERFKEIKDEKRRTYAAMMSAMDDAIGNVVAKIEATGAINDTLVFFVSDNGGPPANASNNGSLHGHKASTWEGGIRVPYLVKWPGKVPAGKTFDPPVIQLDFVPTALAAAGVRIDPKWNLDGVDLVPYLTGEKTEPPHAALYWRFGKQIAIRAGDWKLVKANEAPRGARDAALADKATLEGAKLFNLKDDLGEATDLAAKNPEKVKELGALWSKWNEGLVAPTWIPRAQAKK